MYELDKVYDFGGETRRVTGFDGAGNPITTLEHGAETSTPNQPDYKGLLKILPMEKCSIPELQSVAAFLGVTLVPTTEGKELTKAEIIAQMGA